jgi:hypothetical protein
VCVKMPHTPGDPESWSYRAVSDSCGRGFPAPWISIPLIHFHLYVPDLPASLHT